MQTTWSYPQVNPEGNTMHTTQARSLALADRDGLAVIGRTLADLRGHRFTTEPGGNQPPAPAAPPANEPPAAPQAPLPGQRPEQPASPAANQPPARTEIADLPADIQELIRRTREEAKGYREERDQFKSQIDTLTPAQQTLEALRATLTGDGGKAPATPEELQAQVQAQQTAAQQAQQEAAAAQRQVAVMRTAALPDVNANANRLLDSVSFMAAVAALPNADEGSVRALIEQQVQTDPSLRIIPIAAGSGGATHGGARPTTGRKSLQDAVGEVYQKNPLGRRSQ